MTNQKNSNVLEPGSFFVFRTPLLPRTHLNFSSQNTASNLVELGLQLLKKYENPDLRQALYLASPDLFNQLDRWKKLLNHENPNKKVRKERNELNRKFLMFLLRAAHRCTPFGTFAAVTVGDFKLQRESNLDLSKLSPLRKSSRLDMVYLLRLKSVIEADEQLKVQLKFFPNNTLYKHGDDMLCSFFDEKELQHVASSKSFNEVAWELFENAYKTGGMTIDQMVDFVIDPELTREDCLEFINYLIDHQLLISELYPRLNGEEYLEQIYQKITPLEVSTPHLHFIEAIRQQLKDIDATTNAATCLPKYQELLSFLTEGELATQLTLKTDQTKEKELVQVDAFKHLEAQELSKTVARDIVRKIETLYQLPTPKGTPHQDLDVFKEALSKQYENEAVPLLEIMDEVTGLGYPYGKRVASLTSNLKELKVIFNEEIPIKRANPPQETNVVDEWLRQKFQDALQQHHSQIDLTIEDIKKLSNTPQNNTDPISPAMLAMGKLLFESADDLLHDPKNGNPRNFYFQLYQAAGPGIGNLLGRFCHGSTTLRENLQREIAQIEPDTEEVIYAEIDHLPGQRVGNVILRPKLRDYTITLGGTNTNDPYLIPVSELWLKISDNNQLILFSKKLNKIIVPRMSNAHNYSHNAHPLYKFLCDLQYQQTYRGIPAFFNTRHWQATPYLPRLVYDNIILSPQTWRINKKTLEELGFKKNENLDNPDWQVKTQKLQAHTKLPDQALLVEGDNKLYLDFTNPLCVGAFLQKAFKNTTVVLEEVVEQPFASQAYSNEMIFPIINTEIKSAKKELNFQFDPDEVQKKYTFGSEWIYYKIYLGNPGADRVITQHLYPLSQQLKNKGLIKDWFFIRYTDDQLGSHLRWRFLLNDLTNFGQVVHIFTQTLLNLQKQKLIIHSIPDTYQRELSRYLPYNIETSERLFGGDSWFVCHALYMLAIDETSTLHPDQIKLVLALKRIQQLFQGLELSSETIHKIIIGGQTNFTKEFGFDKHPKSKMLKDSLGKNYLEQLIKPALSTQSIQEINPDFQMLVTQLGQLEKPILLKVKENLRQNGGEESEVISLVGSYIHMFVNRFFSTTQRFQEMWLYSAFAMALEKPHPQE